MQHFHVSGFCLCGEKVGDGGRNHHSGGVFLFCAPAKDKLLLLKAAETFRALQRDAGGRGPGSLPSRKCVYERETQRER